MRVLLVILIYSIITTNSFSGSETGDDKYSDILIASTSTRSRYKSKKSVPYNDPQLSAVLTDIQSKYHDYTVSRIIVSKNYYLITLSLRGSYKESELLLIKR